MLPERLYVLCCMAFLRGMRLQASEHVKHSGATLYTDFNERMHEPHKNVMSSIQKLTASCQPVLLLGWSPQRAATIRDALIDFEQSR